MFSKIFLQNILKISFKKFSTTISIKNINYSRASNYFKDNPSPFGFIFDIDGVFVRGKTLLPQAYRAVHEMLVDKNNNFIVPTVFVTNAGNTLRSSKAEQLSALLEIKVTPEQIILSHSPLKLFSNFHNLHVLISGQGPIVEIAQNLGFKKTITVDQLRHSFPYLDMVDFKRRIHAPCAFEEFFQPIEAVVLFGEPVRWESHLQLILDTILSHGMPDLHRTNKLQPIEKRRKITDLPHLPVLACNMDLLWMAEAPLPRFGHGTFLLCLEELYKKITGNQLTYTALSGKPCELTYHHAQYCLSQISLAMGVEVPLKRIYAIGDNPDSDIYGANSYSKFLKDFKTANNMDEMMAKFGKSFANLNELDESMVNELLSTTKYLECMKSILVLTGVYSHGSGSLEAVENDREKNQHHNDNGNIINHGHRDIHMDKRLLIPNFTVNSIYDAINLVYEKEKFSL
ncbi:hypothetical protein SNEBB_001944 [Seison nebaliae]|nr:hypothetical protein SNEBB_001944 [Seison nebaliae]